MVLGVSAYYHDSAASLVIDGTVVAATHEERFTRRKHDASFPEHAIRSVLECADLEPVDLTAVVYYESPFAKFERILSTQVTGRLRGGLHFARSVSTTFPSKMRVETELKRVLGKSVPLHYSDHHLSHTASAFYPSPYEEAAILTVDGVGEWTTTSIGVGKGDRLELLEHIEYPNSLGLFYSTMTAYCGFRVNSGEYKLMGLAPYGDPLVAKRLADRMRGEILYLAADGSFALNPAYFCYFSSNKAYGAVLETFFGRRGRKEDDPLVQHYADVAAATQMLLNEAMLGLVSRAFELTGMRALCMAGGVALNVTANSFVAEQGPFDSVWVQPAAGDAGGSLGAALWASHEVHGVPRPARSGDGMSGALLGPAIGDRAGQVLQSRGLRGVRLGVVETAAEISRVLAEGGVVGVASGRMEFGPRALGARSVLADPRVPGMQKRLNLQTKLREGFRPFAPAVRLEEVSDWFLTEEESPFMLRTVSVRGAQVLDSTSGDWAARLASVGGPIPAVTHVDGSARVQTVAVRDNPLLHGILTAFKELTGCPVLVNTSFNVRGEPIVCTEEEAVDAFLRMSLDALLLGDFLVLRSAQSSTALAAEPPKLTGTD